MLLSTLRQFGAACLVIIAPFHVGAESALAILAFHSSSYWGANPLLLPSFPQAAKQARDLSDGVLSSRSFSMIQCCELRINLPIGQGPFWICEASA